MAHPSSMAFMGWNDQLLDCYRLCRVPIIDRFQEPTCISSFPAEMAHQFANFIVHPMIQHLVLIFLTSVHRSFLAPWAVNIPSSQVEGRLAFLRTEFGSVILGCAAVAQIQLFHGGVQMPVAFFHMEQGIRSAEFVTIVVAVGL